MNRMKKTLALAPLCGAAAIALATLPAHATAYLYVYDTSTGTDLCSLSSASDGALNCAGKIGSFSFTADTGLDLTAGGLPSLDLDFDGAGKAPPKDTLEITYYINDAVPTGPTAFLTTWGGTASKGITGSFESAYEDASGFYPLATFGSASPTFSGSWLAGPVTIVPFPGDTYELGFIDDLNLNSGAGQVISGDMSLQAYVPEPATLALFAAGLLGGAVGLRRRRG
jgi:hypothetical protein